MSYRWRKLFRWITGRIRRPARQETPTTSIIVSTDASRAQRSRRAPPLDIVLGLDFGTSCTKAIIRTPFAYDGRTVAVPLQPRLRGPARYLLPSRIWASANGALQTSPAGAAREWDTPKMMLLERRSPLESLTLAAGYLAVAIRTAVTWHEEAERDVAADHALRWHLHLGVPSTGFDDNSLKLDFGLAAAIAWILATASGPITLDHARQMATIALNGSGESPEPSARVFVYPEVLAEVAGYVSSPERRDGLHLVIDAGAHTLDVSGFILHENEGENQLSMLACAVEDLGSLVLNRERVDYVASLGIGECPIPHPPTDLTAPLPHDLAKYLPPGCGEQVKHLAAVDHEFAKACSRVLWKVVHTIRHGKDSRAPAFEEGLPVFLCGGAARSEVYRKALESTKHNITRYWTNVSPPRLLQIPKPRGLILEGEPEVFARLAVAYGLSLDRDELARVTSPNEIHDLPPPTKIDFTADFVDKDMV